MMGEATYDPLDEIEDEKLDAAREAVSHGAGGTILETCASKGGKSLHQPSAPLEEE